MVTRIFSDLLMPHWSQHGRFRAEKSNAVLQCALYFHTVATLNMFRFYNDFFFHFHIHLANAEGLLYFYSCVFDIARGPLVRALHTFYDLIRGICCRTLTMILYISIGLHRVGIEGALDLTLIWTDISFGICAIVIYHHGDYKVLWKFNNNETMRYC